MDLHWPPAALAFPTGPGIPPAPPCWRRPRRTPISGGIGVGVWVINRARKLRPRTHAEVASATENRSGTGIVFALDGILIGAGDLRFLAISMVAATAVLIAGSFAVLGLGLGIGWLWGALGAWMAVRGAALYARYRTDAWLVTGAVS